MKKILLITLLLCLLFTISTQANIITEFNYTSFDEGSYIYGGIRANIDDDLAIMAAGNTFSTVLGDIRAFDILGGFNFEFTPLLSDYPSENTLMGGARVGEFQNGFLIKLISRQDYTEEIFSFGDIEYIVWPEGNNALKNQIMIGYQVVEELAIKGGLNSIMSGGNTSWGLSFGIENRF